MKEDKIKELEQELLTRQDVMRILKKSQPTIWAWVRKGVIREHRLGKSVFYYRHELLEDIEKNKLPLERNSRIKN